jgi:uncharacterized membrane protein YGL010W
MKTTQEWFDAYGASHQNPINKKIHWVCIPLIMLSLIGLLWEIPTPVAHPMINFGTLLLALSLAYYMLLSRSLAFGMLIIAAGMVAGVLYLETLCAQWMLSLWQGSLIIFVLAWIGQFIGHKIEGEKPSFFEDLQFLLIGPLWLLGFIYRRLGVGY